MKLPAKGVLLSAAAIGCFAAGAAFAQAPDDQDDKTGTPTPEVAQPAPPAPPALTPAIDSVREVEIGMTVDQVREKLGKPTVEDGTGLYFDLDKGDSVQIGLDPDKKVRTIAAIYAAGSKTAPSFTDVFGPTEGETEGDVYKLERYPEAGYWVSYSRTNSKDKPVVVVMLRRID